MQHTVKAATVTATSDLGEFTAIAAAYTLDRDGDEIIFGAFGNSIKKWRQSGKRIPLHWNHSGEASDIIGSVDPAKLREVKGTGLEASGRLDLEESETAREAWRSMKDGRMSLSFGYLVVLQSKRKDGVNELHELDLFEISIVPVPANPDTRVLSMKSAEDLRSESARIERELNDESLPALSPEPVVEEPEPEPVVELPAPVAKDAETLRRESERLDRKLAEERIPDVPDPEPVVVEPEPATAKDIIALAAALADDDKRAVKDAIVLPEPIDPETQRKESQRLEREIAEKQLPDVPEQPKAPEPDLAKELQEVKGRLEKTEKSLEDLKRKAEETDKEPQARSVDPLRKRSEEWSLEVASDGMSLRRPPTKAPEPEPDLIPLGELKRRSRDLMFDLLSRDME
jgi:HK97 family phage prohead protease